MPRTPWLLVSAWSEDCTRLRPHLVKLNAPGGGGGGGGGGEGGGGCGGEGNPRQLPLVVSAWPPESNVEHPESQLLQKNWVPFSHEGSLFAEYSIEPHVVLRIDPESGRCVPVLPRGIAISARGAMGGSKVTFPSFVPLARIAAEYGRLSGGVPPVHLPAHHVYLSYAHTKASRSMPQYLGTSSMAYKHLFYAFEEESPFAVIAAGPLHTLPEPPRRAERTFPTVQFAAGMILDEATGRPGHLVQYDGLWRAPHSSAHGERVAGHRVSVVTGRPGVTQAPGTSAVSGLRRVVVVAVSRLFRWASEPPRLIRPHVTKTYTYGRSLRRTCMHRSPVASWPLAGASTWSSSVWACSVWAMGHVARARCMACVADGTGRADRPATLKLLHIP